MINLTNAIERTKLQYRIKADIEEACVKHFADESRKHLGASIIGHDCQAYLWGVFRHLKQEQFEGRMLRLFNRGHLEEARFIKWLELIGFTCWETNPETGKQFQISGVNGHFGGSLDAVFKAPERYEVQDFLIWLGEFKTHGEKSFEKLKKEGVRKANPKHYRQMCSYGKAYNFRFGLYMAVNKNTDEIYLEIIELDFKLAEYLFRKAEGIIGSQTQPAKIAQSETFADCKYCFLKGICHQGQEPDKNCRSCANAFPTENASWTCGLNNQQIPETVIKEGCPSWRRII